MRVEVEVSDGEKVIAKRDFDNPGFAKQCFDVAWQSIQEEFDWSDAMMKWKSITVKVTR